MKASFLFGNSSLSLAGSLVLLAVGKDVAGWAWQVGGRQYLLLFLLSQLCEALHLQGYKEFMLWWDMDLTQVGSWVIAAGTSWTGRGNKTRSPLLSGTGWCLAW